LAEPATPVVGNTVCFFIYLFYCNNSFQQQQFGLGHRANANSILTIHIAQKEYSAWPWTRTHQLIENGGRWRGRLEEKDNILVDCMLFSRGWRGMGPREGGGVEFTRRRVWTL
jgi:hypothetical protein